MLLFVLVLECRPLMDGISRMLSLRRNPSIHPSIQRGSSAVQCSAFSLTLYQELPVALHIMIHSL